MFTYIITAFSFLASYLGWFGALPQTEVFFWSELVWSVVLAVVLLVVCLVGGGADSGGVWGVIAGGFIGFLAVIMLVVSFLLSMLIAWICTQLWGLDFFLAFQIVLIGISTGQLFTSRKRD